MKLIAYLWIILTKSIPMIASELINPRSIVVVGGSEDVRRPGGAVVRNLIDHHFNGDIYVVNRKAEGPVCNLKTFKTVEDIPDVDLAILAIPSEDFAEVAEILCGKKCCKALIAFTSGLGKFYNGGESVEQRLKNIADNAGATLIGPNCIGVMTPYYVGSFTNNVPVLVSKGADLISSSGTIIVSVVEQSIKLGLRISSVFSVGNSVQTGVEDILEYLDETYVHGECAPVKMLYIESIANPVKFLKHASSLIRKGAGIVAIKSGYSSAGSRAATSHTGAMATEDTVIDALFTKAGIVRCYSRTELVNLCAAMMLPRPSGNRMAIISHGGGLAVMLTDVLSTNGIKIPKIDGAAAENLVKKLHDGAYVSNPIDFLPTGTAAHLEAIIDACENEFDVDAMTIILDKLLDNNLSDLCNVMLKKQNRCRKPIYTVMTSIDKAAKEIDYFHEKGGISFTDEAIFGKVFTKILNTKQISEKAVLPPVDTRIIRRIIDNSPDGYLPSDKVLEILDASGINRLSQMVVENKKEKIEEALNIAHQFGWPVVMKVSGPFHRSEVDGVCLNIMDDRLFKEEFNRMIRIRDVNGIIIQPMLYGNQVFVGAKRESNYGHLIVCGMGGVYIEVNKDITYCLSPVSNSEASNMIKGLKSYNLIRGVRGQEGINENIFAEVIRRVSALCNIAPEIYEMDINPLIGNMRGLTAVDARIRIERNVH